MRHPPGHHDRRRRARGEILASRAGAGPDAHDLELAYGVGSRFRRQGLAAAAVRLTTGYADDVLGVAGVLLRITPADTASIRVAEAAGFQLTDEEPVVRERDGRRVVLRTRRHRGRS